MRLISCSSCNSWQDTEYMYFPKLSNYSFKIVRRMYMFCLIYYPCSRLGARWLQIGRLWCCCLCGQLKQGGGDSSRAPWGHLWNRLTNVSLLCQKDTRLTSCRLMPLLQHIYLSPRYLSLQCLALYYHG